MYLRHFGVYQIIRGQATVDRILRYRYVLEVVDCTDVHMETDGRRNKTENKGKVVPVLH
jgi:hypothetical protein